MPVGVIPHQIFHSVFEDPDGQRNDQPPQIQDSNQFPSLPLELREHIYEYAMRDEFGMIEMENSMPKWWCGEWNSRSPKFLPALCRTLQEAVPVFIRNCAFTIRKYEENIFFLEFLKSVDASLLAVRELHFALFYRCPIWVKREGNADFELMKLCPGLHTVLFTMPVNHLRHIYNGDYPLETVEEAVDVFRFEQLFLCKGLKKVIFDGVCASPRPTDASDHLEELAQLVRDEFERLGRNVDVQVTWLRLDQWGIWETS